MKEISRINDYFARYLFGKENNESVLLNFINAVMKDSGFQPFDTIEVINPFNLKENYLSAETIVDVKAKNEKGEIVIIEIQTSGGKNFIDRVLQYWAKNFTSIVEDIKNVGRQQTKKEKLTEEELREIAKQKVEIKAVICITIVDFKVKPDIQDAHTTHMICCLNDQQVTSDKLRMHFLELPKSTETLKEKELALWHTFFSSQNFEEDKAMLAKQSAPLQKAVNDYEKFRANKDYMSEYDKRQTFLIGQSIMLQGALEQGIEQGIQQVARRLLAKEYYTGSCFRYRFIRGCYKKVALRETAKKHKLNLFDYLKSVFPFLHVHSILDKNFQTTCIKYCKKNLNLKLHRTKMTHLLLHFHEFYKR